MEIAYLGQTAFKIRGKNLIIVTDPFSPKEKGLSVFHIDADIVLITGDSPQQDNWQKFIKSRLDIFGPGEYEVRSVSIIGYPSKKNFDKKGYPPTFYKINIDNINLLFLSNDCGSLSTEQTDTIGDIDILFLPIGEPPFFKAKAATDFVNLIEPRLIIPIKPFQKDAKASKSDDDFTSFLKEFSTDNIKKEKKFFITADKLPSETEIYLLV